MAEAEYERARGAARPELWSDAAATWERLERPPLAAYCRWRQAEALVAAGASARRGERAAPGGARRRGPDRSKPLLRELELLAERARLDLAPPDAQSTDDTQGLEELLGPHAARGRGADARRPRLHQPRDRRALVISVKTASVHVSHILRKLDAPNRLEAAAIAHRLSPP